MWPVVSGRLGAPRAAGPVSVAEAWVQLLSPASAGPAGQFWVVAVDSGFFSRLEFFKAHFMVLFSS